MSDPVLTARDIHVRYGDAEAVRGADLTIAPGEAVALIGETGSGKTSLALAIARLLPHGSSVEGSVEIDDTDTLTLTPAEMRRLRGKIVGFIAQDAMAALNPTTRVGIQIAEAFEVHEGLSRSEARLRAVALLREVRIPDPQGVARLFPHQLSGGMRQRVMIAIAFALGPPLIVADEPTTALDVSTQAEILELVTLLRRETNAAFLWITHDMGVVAEIADRVAVMYRGRVVEEGSAEELFDAPAHPYTEALLRTLHDLREGRPGDRLYQIEGQPPAIEQTIDGCAFHPRCPQATDRCRTEDPVLRHVDARAFACHHPSGAMPP